MVSIVGVSGSPRREGNSAIMLERILHGAERHGAHREGVLHPDRMRFRGCQNCGGCSETGSCVVSDDMDEAYRLLERSAIWVFASPIYFDMVSGQLKLLFDRLYCYWIRATVLKRPLAGVRAAAIAIAYEADETPAYRDNAGILMGYVRRLGNFTATEILVGDALGRPGRAAEKAELLTRAEAIGETLVRSLLSVPSKNRESSTS
jgi:multimeric flavodoxin WrbA